jgi:hypothetical protein
MNQLQTGILGTAVVALLVAGLFFIPWRVDETNELAWAPFYRNPVEFEAAYMDGRTRSVFRQVKGRRAWAVYTLQFVLIGGSGWIAFAAAADRPDDGEEQNDKQP